MYQLSHNIIEGHDLNLKLVLGKKTSVQNILILKPISTKKFACTGQRRKGRVCKLQ